MQALAKVFVVRSNILLNSSRSFHNSLSLYRRRRKTEPLRSSAAKGAPTSYGDLFAKGTMSYNQSQGLIYDGVQVPENLGSYFLDPYLIKTSRQAVQEKMAHKLSQQKLEKAQEKILASLKPKKELSEKSLAMKDRSLSQKEAVLLREMETVVQNLSPSEKFGPICIEAGLIVSSLSLQSDGKKIFVIWDVTAPKMAQQVEKLLKKNATIKRFRYLLAKQISDWKRIPELEFIRKGSTEAEFREKQVDTSLGNLDVILNNIRTRRLEMEKLHEAKAKGDKRAAEILDNMQPDFSPLTKFAKTVSLRTDKKGDPENSPSKPIREQFEEEFEDYEDFEDFEDYENFEDEEFEDENFEDEEFEDEEVEEQHTPPPKKGRK